MVVVVVVGGKAKEVLSLKPHGWELRGFLVSVVDAVFLANPAVAS